MMFFDYKPQIWMNLGGNNLSFATFFGHLFSNDLLHQQLRRGDGRLGTGDAAPWHSSNGSMYHGNPPFPSFLGGITCITHILGGVKPELISWVLGSKGMVYLPTWMVELYGKLVGKYTIHYMDDMGRGTWDMLGLAIKHIKPHEAAVHVFKWDIL